MDLEKPLESGYWETPGMEKLQLCFSPLFSRVSSPLTDCKGTVLQEGSVVTFNEDKLHTGIVIFGGYREVDQNFGGHFGFYLIWDFPWARHDILYWLSRTNNLTVVDSVYHMYDGRTFLNREELESLQRSVDYWYRENISVKI